MAQGAETHALHAETPDLIPSPSWFSHTQAQETISVPDQKTHLKSTAPSSFFHIFFLILGTTSSGAQGFFLTLCSGITPGGPGGLYSVLGIGPRLGMCKKKHPEYYYSSPEKLFFPVFHMSPVEIA